MGGRADLTSNIDVTVALIADPWAWKVRVVEQIDVDSPASARRRRSLQCATLRPVIAAAAALASAKDADEPDEALVVVPIAPIPKGPLLEFDVEGPGGSPAFLVQRADIASREASFLGACARDVGRPLSPRVLAIVEATLGFTESHWARYRPDLVAYLDSGLEAAFERDLADACVARSVQAAQVLAPYADVPDPLDSAVENPALVVPGLVASGTLAVPEVVPALTEYVGWLTDVRSIAESESPRAYHAATLLEALVDYGRYYDLMAIVAVPLDEPFLIKIADRRPLDLSIRNEGTQSVVIADARSNHVALRVVDPNFRLTDVRAQSAAGTGTAYGTFTSRESAQVHAFYAFEPDRAYRITLRFRVALLVRLQVVPYALTVLLVAAAVAVYSLRPVPSDLALIVGPVLFTATLLLSREPSALGSRLRRLTTAALGAAMVLVGVASAIALWDHKP